MTVPNKWVRLADVWATIPEDDKKELEAIFEDWEDSFDCMDNTRVARIGDKEQEDFYYEVQRNGCCGYRDIIKMCSSARQYRVGCNYGH